MNNEDIKIIEHIIKEYKYLDSIHSSDKPCLEIRALQNLIARNKELEEMLKNRIKYTNELEKDLFENCNNHVIPKSKVREKIEEYNKIRQMTKDNEIYTRMVDYIDILQELLQEGDK